jgi:hypothetical protein
MTISSNEYERSQSVGYGSFLEQIYDRALTQLECAQRKAKGNRCRPSWTSRFPDPEGRESATPFPRWLCVRSYPSRWLPHGLRN